MRSMESVWRERARREKRAEEIVRNAISKASASGLLKADEIKIESFKSDFINYIPDQKTVVIDAIGGIKKIPMQRIKDFIIYPLNEQVHIAIRQYEWQSLDLILKTPYKKFKRTENEYAFARESIEQICNKIKESEKPSKENIITLAETVKKTKLKDFTVPDLIAYYQMKEKFKDNQYINRINNYLEKKIIKNI